MKSKPSLNAHSIIGSLPNDTIIEQNNSNDEKTKMKFFKKASADDSYRSIE